MEKVQEESKHVHVCVRTLCTYVHTCARGLKTRPLPEA